MIYRLAVLICVVASTASCIPVGADGAVSVRGEVVDQFGLQYEECTVSL